MISSAIRSMDRPHFLYLLVYKLLSCITPPPHLGMEKFETKITETYAITESLLLQSTAVKHIVA